MARYKINAVIWELEDKLRYTRRPEIGAPNAISKQEMQALCRYAKERNIEITPGPRFGTCRFTFKTSLGTT